jgi:hypothetical protein
MDISQRLAIMMTQIEAIMTIFRVRLVSGFAAAAAGVVLAVKEL